MVLTLGAHAAAQGTPRAPRQSTKPQRFFDWAEPTFGPAEYRARRARILALLKQKGGGVLLVPSAEGRSGGETFRQRDDFLYFTGLELPRSILAIDADAGAIALYAPATDKRFMNVARRNDFPGRRLAGDPELGRRSGLTKVHPFSAFTEHVAKWHATGSRLLLNSGRAGKLPALTPALWQTRDEVGALQAWLTNTFKSPKLANAFASIATVRMVKTKREILVLRRAAEITAAGIRAAARQVRNGVDERTLEGVLELTFKAGGAQRPAFASIIKSGPNSLWPWRILAAHYDRRNRKMQAPDLVIFDVGCELHHYVSDVGRTFPVGGTFTARQAEILKMATRVADTIIAKVRPGTTLAQLQKHAFAAIPKDHRKYMQTGLFFGHHIGLAVGDPSLSSVPLAPGMVFTVEPWYYNHDEDIAVFVEDVILVTKDGAENLTASLPRDPEGLAAMVGK